MPLLQIKAPITVTSPVMVLAIGGWVDRGRVASQVGEDLTEGGRMVAEFDPDQIFDYHSNRPTVELADGSPASISWPELAIRSASIEGVDLLVVTGTEPGLRWHDVAAELAGLANTVGVTRLVSVGAVPAVAAHTQPTPIMTTSTDPALGSEGLPPGTFTVPGALVNVIDQRIQQALAVPTVGFWAQVPHYVTGVYWPGVEAMTTRVSRYLGIRTDTGGLRSLAEEMRRRLDRAVASRPEAAEYVARLEQARPRFATDPGDGLAREVEEFLKSIGEEDDPLT